MELTIDGKKKSYPFCQEEIDTMLAMYAAYSTPKQIEYVLYAKGFDRKAGSIGQFILRRFGRDALGMQSADETLKKVREMREHCNDVKILAVQTGLTERTIRHILSDVSDKVQVRTVKMVAEAYDRMQALIERERQEQQGDSSATS